MTLSIIISAYFLFFVPICVYGESSTGYDDYSVNRMLEEFKNGEHHFKPGESCKVVDLWGPNCDMHETHLMANNCTGLTVRLHTVFRTVVLECPRKKSQKPGCFNFYDTNFDSPSVRKEEGMVCLQRVSDNCVGIPMRNTVAVIRCSGVLALAAVKDNLDENSTPARQ